MNKNSNPDKKKDEEKKKKTPPPVNIELMKQAMKNKTKVLSTNQIVNKES